MNQPEDKKDSDLTQEELDVLTEEKSRRLSGKLPDQKDTIAQKLEVEEEKQKIKYEPHYRCNFCSKGAERVFLLIQGPSVNICNECILEGMKLVQEEVVRRETKLNKVVSFDEKEDNTDDNGGKE